ncbi:MAG TPA: glycoside hydrolase family 3 C-terminal domain-containing protein [Pseudonocardiaceae bacterium]|nr:glycoside hydrolase family 3 C-terminal domain-containing protein [Pseudonocardiaceae bacterium]
MSTARRWRLRVAFAAAVVVAGTGAVSAYGASADDFPVNCPWLNTHQTADQRAHELLDASTLNQKLRWLDEQAANSPTQTTFGGVTYPVQVPCTPTVVYTDGPDYVRGSAGVTVFPAQIDLAASWNTDLAYAKGKAQGDEAFRSGKNVILGPGVSSSRTPLAGRTPEYLGEDSLLSGDLAAADINGIQTGNPNEPVMSVVKHFIANEQELDRMRGSSNIDGRTLREVYNQPFAIAIAQGHPGGVMCSYNQVNGTFACENPVLDNLLKGADGFTGYVTSDFGAVHTTGPSLTNGLDQELNRPVFYTPANINSAIDSGQVSQAEIDAAAFRVVHAYLQAGLFDHPLPTTPSTSASDPANRAVAADIAEQGSVLLRNADDVLPLTGATKSIAVIGPTASDTPTGGISAGTVCAEGGATAVACPDPVAPLDAITARAATAGATVSYASGADLTTAADTARAANVAVVFAYAKQGEGADRTSLSLDDNGDALISAVAAANPNTVVVLETGTAVTMPWLNQVKGVIEAWYPGDQQGTALARLLYGDVDFSGRLPMTFPVSLADSPEQTPAQYPGTLAAGATIRQVSYAEGLAVGYKWYDGQGIAALFPFGFGLSYTSFGYSHLRISTGRTVKVDFDVTNTGSVTGTETPQVYVTLPAAANEPGKRLVGFDQVTLRPGKAAHVEVTVDPSTPDHPLSYWDTAARAWTTAPGTYGVQVGSSSRNLPLGGQFQR